MFKFPLRYDFCIVTVVFLSILFFVYTVIEGNCIGVDLIACQLNLILPLIKWLSRNHRLFIKVWLVTWINRWITTVQLYKKNEKHLKRNFLRANSRIADIEIETINLPHLFHVHWKTLLVAVATVPSESKRMETPMKIRMILPSIKRPAQKLAPMYKHASSKLVVVEHTVHVDDILLAWRITSIYNINDEINQTKPKTKT